MCQADYAKNVYISAIGGTGGSGGAGDTKGGNGGPGEGPHITINSPTGKIVIWGDKLKEVLHEWLTPPKVSDKQLELQEQQHKSTGSWLLDDFRFQKWQTTPSSLWIKGFSGTGKSVLR
ncbi:Ankyrin repeat-containing protein [Mycena sanguinolenta]|uniref:Ankyrin repeat-containing protein n=1 Tax=Mycena sanguinolenta TaxID=230812 RepID=A0A8H6ZJE4_9AGAR|nr:Ankyrin repeat-containing protein [Mycena sanguinolenta]